MVLEALPKVRLGSRGPSRVPGRVRRPCWMSLGVGTSSRRFDRGRKTLLEVYEGSGGPP